ANVESSIATGLSPGGGVAKDGCILASLSERHTIRDTLLLCEACHTLQSYALSVWCPCTGSKRLQHAPTRPNHHTHMSVDFFAVSWSLLATPGFFRDSKSRAPSSSASLTQAIAQHK